MKLTIIIIDGDYCQSWYELNGSFSRSNREACLEFFVYFIDDISLDTNSEDFSAVGWTEGEGAGYC